MVDQDGKVTGGEEGKATITAKTVDGGFEANCRVMVAKEFILPTSIIVDPATLSLIEGDTVTLTATVLPTETTDKTVEWSSTNPSSATVSHSGLVTAIAEGSATIIVTCGTISANCEVTIEKATATAVDLGLRVKWASCNLGASSPEEYGDYYAWGEIIPYYTEGHSQDNPCTSWQYRSGHYLFRGYWWSSYKWCHGGDKLTKYCPSDKIGCWYYGGGNSPDNKIVLDSEDDVARATWGGAWRMPTLWDYIELESNTTSEWTTLNGTDGRLFTSKVNGNHIFFPAAGCRVEERFSNAGSAGFYWYTSLNTDEPHYAWSLQFNSVNVRKYYYGRYYGFSVRPVYE